MNTTTKIAIAAAAGLVAGAAIGLLLAPAEGADTRKKIVKGASSLADAVKDKVSACKNACREAGELVG